MYYVVSLSASLTVLMNKGGMGVLLKLQWFVENHFLGIEVLFSPAGGSHTSLLKETLGL